MHSKNTAPNYFKESSAVPFIQMRPHEGRVEGKITSLILLTTHLLMQPRIQLGCQAAREHCCFTWSFSCIRTPKCFPARGCSQWALLLDCTVQSGIAPTQVQYPALGLMEPRLSGKLRWQVLAYYKDVTQYVLYFLVSSISICFALTEAVLFLSNLVLEIWRRTKMFTTNRLDLNS